MKNSVIFFMHFFCITSINCAERPPIVIPPADLQLMKNLCREGFKISSDTRRHGTEERQIAEEDKKVIECLDKYPVTMLYNREAIKGGVPLYTACALNRPGIVSYLARRGLPPRETVERSCVVSSARIAAEKGHFRPVSALARYLVGSEIIQEDKDTGESIFSHTLNSGEHQLLWSFLQKRIPQNFFDDNQNLLGYVLDKRENLGAFDKIGRMFVLYCEVERRRYTCQVDAALLKQFPLTNDALRIVCSRPISEKGKSLQEIRDKINDSYGLTSKK